MKKKGFTLIEIIICISLIAILGASSVIGINIVNKNIRIDKLKQITDKVLQAAEVYIETHNDTKMQIYDNKNGAIIPLNVLVNEGLLNLDNTDLKENDIGDEYIVAMLSEEKGECIDLKLKTSWSESSNEPIYICSNGGGDNQELLERINRLETALSLFTYPDYNYVLFDVESKTSEKSYWPDNEMQDLWAIVKNDINQGEFKLLYTQDITNDDSDGWTFPEMVYNKYNTASSRKKILYDSINSNLVNDIVSKNYYYKYISSDNLTPIYKYNDKFGTIDRTDNIISPSLNGKKFFVGITSGVSGAYREHYGWVFINNSNFIYQSVNGCNCLDPDKDETYKSKFGFDDISYEGNYFKTKYVPVITVKYKFLLNVYDDYPDSYKTKYPSCDTTKLGSKECPKIIKLNSGNLSWGN